MPKRLKGPRGRRRWVRAAVWFALLASQSSACADRPHLSDTFLQDWKRARSRGEQSFEKTSTVGAARIDAPAPETLDRVDVVLVKVTKPAEFTSSHLTLETWHAMDVVRRSQAEEPKPGGACSWPKPAVFGPSSALVVHGGTYTHRGTTGRYSTPESIDFTAGREYLLLGFECPQGYVRLADGKRGVFLVSTTGSILEPNWSTIPGGVTEEFDKLRSVEAIFEFVEKLRALRRNSR